MAALSLLHDQPIPAAWAEEQHSTDAAPQAPGNPCGRRTASLGPPRAPIGPGSCPTPPGRPMHRPVSRSQQPLRQTASSFSLVLVAAPPPPPPSGGAAVPVSVACAQLRCGGSAGAGGALEPAEAEAAVRPEDDEDEEEALPHSEAVDVFQEGLAMVVQDPLLCDLPIQVRAGGGPPGSFPHGRGADGPREALVGGCGPEASRRRFWAPTKVLTGLGAGAREALTWRAELKRARGKHWSGNMTF